MSRSVRDFVAKDILLRHSLSITDYIIAHILGFWLVLAYDLLEDRHTINVIITSAF